jgi:DNA-binding winged helix-turn-helix (wHTH) protein/dienelactone hydrolase
MSAAGSPTAIDLAREGGFEVGGLRVRPATREVEGTAGTETLEPRVMQVLVALAQRQGEVLSRDELIARCWAGRVVSDDAVHRCIARLRRLAQTHGGFAVETIPRVGYRVTTLPAPAALASASTAQTRRAAARLKISAAAVAALAVAAAAAWVTLPTEPPPATRDGAISKIVELTQSDQYGEAFQLALPLVKNGALEHDAALAIAWQQIALPMRPLVAEDGATVYFKGYSDIDGPWIEAGVTPIERPVDAPRGTLRIKIEKPGFRTAYFAVANPGPSVVSEPPDEFITRNRIAEIPLPLVREGGGPDDMVLVPRTNIPVFVPGWSTSRAGSFREDIPAFFIARNEVTNQQFKEFVDAGGYDNAVYWQGFEFLDGDRTLSWEEARARFVDSTGRPGPAEWQLSTYPAGRDASPVGGISWYEAAAYARFRGQTLPTIHHWARAAFGPLDPRFNVAPMVAVASRYSATGPAAADSELGLGPWGTFHTAGNVREWAWNFTDKGMAMALGGAWSDYTLENWGTSSTPPMDRSPTNGVRLMRPDPDAALMSRLRQPIRRQNDGVLRPIAPVSDEEFAAMRVRLDRPRPKPLAVSTSIVEETPQRIAEEVVLKFPNDETATLYVVKPQSRGKPLQPIVYAPPMNCCILKRPNRDALEQLVEAGFVVDGGRALVIVIWSGGYERFIPADIDPARLLARQERSALAWARDAAIALDYLETRADNDTDHAGFLGISIGAVGQSIVLAVEPRLKAAVLISGGIDRVNEVHPLADLVNYAPRITIPTLMINGRMDHISPYETAQKPLLDLLGSDASAKAHIVYEGGHFDYRRNMVAKNVSDWFDGHLGPAH